MKPQTCIFLLNVSQHWLRCGWQPQIKVQTWSEGNTPISALLWEELLEGFISRPGQTQQQLADGDTVSVVILHHAAPYSLLPWCPANPPVSLLWLWTSWQLPKACLQRAEEEPGVTTAFFNPRQVSICCIKFGQTRVFSLWQSWTVSNSIETRELIHHWPTVGSMSAVPM